MRFLKVTWSHNHPDEPHLIYQEVDGHARETRKVELLKNGALLGYASEREEVGKSILADQSIPSVEEINEIDGFNAELITKDEFDDVWSWATSA